MNGPISYLITYWQPIFGLGIGTLMVAAYLYLHLNRNKRIIPWMAKHLFRSQMFAERSAEGLFNVVTSFLFMAGGLLVILAIYFLSYSFGPQA
jgi:hypothetical protein